MEAINAVSSPQTKAPAPMRISMSKAKSVPITFATEQAVVARLLHRRLHALDGQRILRAHVDEAFVGADGVAGDEHPLDDGMRVAFHQRAVHECARIAFVGVADDIFLRHPARCSRPAI